MDIFVVERYLREYFKVLEDNSGDLIFFFYFVR